MPLNDITVYAWWREENKACEFTYSGSSSFTINGFNGNGEKLWVPSYIGDKPVTEIKTSAFEYKTDITKVVIPDTVTSIGSGAFKGCNAVEDITLPFVGTSMTSEYSSGKVFGYIFGSYGPVSSSSRTSNGSYTYQSGDGYYIPKSIRKVTITLQTEIPTCAFQNCDLIEEIQIPELTTKIGNSAFYYCEKLNKLNSTEDGTYNLPKQITQIEGNCFYYNKLLQKMNCGNLTSIGLNAFNNCVMLQAFETSALQTIGGLAFSECTMLGIVQTGDVLQTIGQSAFNGCTALLQFNSTANGKFVIPDTVTSIGSGAFKGCDAVEDITLPFVGTSMTSEYSSGKVFGYIFGSYGPVSSSSRTSNGSYTYQSGDGYYIPKSIRKVTITLQTEIPAYAFQNCDLIEEIILPTTFVSAGTGAFTNCTATISYSAKSSVWDGTSVAEAYAGGSGSKENPYQIVNGEQLALLASQVKLGNTYQNACFVLMNDINLNSKQLTIGDKDNVFNGIFDGNGYKIYNYAITTDAVCLGLFGNNSGTIKRLSIAYSSISLSSALVKDIVIGGLVAHNNGIIENCHVSVTMSINCSYKMIVGGIVGINTGTVKHCLIDGAITVESANSKCLVGGIVAQNAVNGNIVGCVAYNSLSSKGLNVGYSLIGGIVADNVGTLTDCYRCDKQILARFGESNSCSNPDGIIATEAEMIEYCRANWGNEWDYSSSRPKLKR